MIPLTVFIVSEKFNPLNNKCCSATMLTTCTFNQTFSFIVVANKFVKPSQLEELKHFRQTKAVAVRKSFQNFVKLGY